MKSIYKCDNMICEYETQYISEKITLIYLLKIIKIY